MRIYKQDDGTYAVYAREPDEVLTEEQYQAWVNDQEEAKRLARVRELSEELYNLGYHVIPMLPEGHADPVGEPGESGIPAEVEEQKTTEASVPVGESKGGFKKKW